MGLRTSDVVPNSEARAPLTELEEEHVELILLNDAEIGLHQVLAGQRVSAGTLSQALAEE